MTNPRKQVWLQKLNCYACDQKWPHDGHVWHLFRTARQPKNSVASPQDQGFYSYFYCDGQLVNHD